MLVPKQDRRVSFQIYLKTQRSILSVIR